VRFSEIARVSGDDDEIVNERGRYNQTILYRHRFTGLAQFGQKPLDRCRALRTPDSRERMSRTL
jgi:hypothetical protein